MNFQEKLFETTAELRARAAEFAQAAVETTRAQAEAAARRAEQLRKPLGVINAAGRELNKVARRHGARFVKQNSALAAKAGEELAALARSTIASLQDTPKARRTSRKRKAKSA
jgi:hypothetical protein